MSDNPLKSYVRKPKLQVLLPSRGKFGDIATSSKITGEIPVYPMTSKDEVLIKNPDALLNGESVASVIKSCTGIENVYDLVNNDIEYLLVAIRYASYGNEMEIDATCPEGHENRVALNLEAILETVEEIDGNFKVVLTNGLTVFVKPLTFKNAQRVSINAFNEASVLQNMQDADVPTIERIKIFNKSFENIADLAVEIMIDSVVKVIMPDETTVDNREHIAEWVRGMSSEENKEIQQRMDEINKKGFEHTYKCKCSECGVEYDANIEFNVSNFFATGS